MDLSAFDYYLPQELIAQEPAPNRDESRLLIARRDKQLLEDTHFHALPEFLEAGDVVVLNDTYVFPARLWGKKDPGGALIEMLLLEKKSHNTWEVIAYRASRLKIGTKVIFSDNFFCVVEGVLPEGKFIVNFAWEGQWEDVLQNHGEIPLPPYIHRDKGNQAEVDRLRYQTVFARQNDRLNSAAAPTAGLHFTDSIFTALQNKGVGIGHVTLRVGLDTFLPIREERIEDHPMHTETYHLPEQTAHLVEKAYRDGKRVVATGTTAMRVLESSATAPGKLNPGEHQTQLFIYPGYKFKIVNTLITNFHLPRTTLILLVSAFMDNQFRNKAYNHAIENKYRFFSYGDAMLIL